MKTKKVLEVNNPVYFGLDYSESLEAKKNLLSSEMSFLNLIKIARRHSQLRKEELELKIKVYRAVKELEVALRKTKSAFPFLKIPERAKRETLRREIIPSKRNIDTDLEGELKRIQERLKSIGSE